MSFRIQLFIGFGAVVLVTLVTGTIAILALRKVTAGTDQVARRFMEQLGTAERARFHAEHLVATTRGYLLTGEGSYLEKYDRTLDSFNVLLAGLKENAQSDRQSFLAEVDAAARAYVAAAEKALDARGESSDPGAIVPYFEEVLKPARDSFDAAIRRLVEAERQAFDAALAGSRRLARRTALLMAISMSLGAGFGIALSWLVSRRVTGLFQREQLAVQATRRAVQARDDVLAVVSHDLRNPLGTVLMGTALLQRSPGIEREPERRQVDSIRSAAARMKHLIEDLLDVTRIEGGAFALRREACDGAKLIEEAVKLFQATAAEKQVRLSARAAAGAVAWADRERTLQVLSNLASNALKFTPEGGSVALEAELDPGGVRFTVRDTGPGISRDQVPLLFERHWQARRTGREGLGLGLYIAKSIVELHGGRIWVESRLGEGSAFFFVLPAAP